MFSLCLLLVVLGSFGSRPAHAGGKEPAVERQDIAVTLVPESHSLTGASTIRFAAGTRYVALRLCSSASIDSVAVSGKEVPYSFAGGLLTLQIPSTGGADGTAVTVSYRASFNDTVLRNPGASEDPSYGVGAAITGAGTFLGDAAYWYPVPSRTPAQRSLRVSAPAGIEGVSFGRRVSRETVGSVTRSHWVEARPVGVLSLCAGPFVIQEKKSDGIEILSYLYPDNAALAPRYLDAAAKYLKFYSDLFGPYPFEKFAIVENFFPTGYGFPSFTLLGGSVIRLPFIIDTSFPHEIAHSWWGNGIAVDLREGNWCEGLVTYLADYYLKELRSTGEAREYRRQLLVDFASLVSPQSDFPLRDFTSRSDPASRAIGYGKGAMVFHMVRTLVGDAPFFAALREVSRQHMYGEASWGDFVRAFSRSSGRDLGPFMGQWLTRPGGPRLRLAEVETRPAAGGWVVSGTVVQEAPGFKLDLPLRLKTAGTEVTRTVPVSSGRSRFELASAAAPRRLLLDPDAEVFRILSPGEIPATVNSVKGSRQLTGVVTENCQARGDTFRDLLASLSQGGAPVITEPQLSPGYSASHDLVFCGIPRDRTLLPALPEGIAVSSSGFSAEGASYPAPDALLFTVLKVPGSADRVAALFQPLSEAAALTYAPKITHYGKYGHLVFAGGGIRSKGTVPAGEGAAVVSLPQR
jgi:aminopeptidase N